MTVQSYPSLPIAQGQSESAFAANDFKDWVTKRIIGLFIPVGFEGASVTFKASFDGTNWFPVYDLDGALYTVNVVGGNYYTLNPQIMAGLAAVKVVAASTQTALRNVVASVRPIN